jgi:hypothetical protein
MYSIAQLLMARVRLRGGMFGGMSALQTGHSRCSRNATKSCDESLVWLKAESLRPDSPWEGLRADPRFTELLQRIGLGR